MSPTDKLSMLKRLETRFDNESVGAVLREFETNSSAFDFWTIRILLNGRGAQAIWPRIEARLKSDLTLRNISNLSSYIRSNEIVELVDRCGISDEVIVQQIKEGKFPAIQMLPNGRRVRIFETLRTIVTSDIHAKYVETILLFLLDFDRGTNAKIITNEQSVKIATEWCLKFRTDERIQEVLTRLLWRRPNAEIIRIAEEHFLNSKVNIRTTLLLTGLMEVLRPRQFLRLLDRWFEHSDTDADKLVGYVVSRWIQRTNGSREALGAGKDVIKDRLPGAYDVIRILAQYFSHRKIVRRWFNRYVESHINTWLVSFVIAQVVSLNPSRHNCAIAKQVLNSTSDVEQRHSILLELILHTKNQDIIDLAKQEVLTYPNAPNSFSMMCSIGKSDPDIAVPWIAEWIKTALPDQACDGLLVIVSVSPTAKNLQIIREWLSTYEESRLRVPHLKKAMLLEKLLRIDPTNNDIYQASALIETVSDKQHPVMRRLAKRLSTAKQFLSQSGA